MGTFDSISESGRREMGRMDVREWRLQGGERGR